MKHNKLQNLRAMIIGIMKAMRTNMAIVVLDEVLIDDEPPHFLNVNKYEVYVTRDKGTDELNFFSMGGVHLTWLASGNTLPSNIKYMEIIKITDISVCKIIEK